MDTKLRTDLHLLYQTVVKKFLIKERLRAFLMPWVQLLYAGYTLFMVVWRIKDYETIYSGDNLGCFVASIVFVVFGLLARFFKRSAMVKSEVPDLLPAEGGEPQAWITNLSNFSVSQANLYAYMPMSALLISVGFAMLRLGCSLNSTSGSYFNDITVTYLLDVPWIVYMAYAIVLGDISFSNSGMILNNLDLYHSASGLSNFEALRAIQSFLFVATVFYDPIYSSVAGFSPDLTAVIALFMLTGNIVIRAVVFPSALQTISSINGVFIVVAILQALALNPIRVLTTAHRVSAQLLAHPLDSLYVLLRGFVHGALRLFTCCRWKSTQGAVEQQPPASQWELKQRPAAPPQAPPQAARDNMVAESGAEHDAGHAGDDALPTGYVSVSVAEQGPVPAKAAPPRFILRQLQALLEKSTGSAGGAPDLVEFIGLTNAMGIAAQAKVRAQWTASDMAAFAAVHSQCVAHLQAGGSLDGFFATALASLKPQPY